MERLPESSRILSFTTTITTTTKWIPSFYATFTFKPTDTTHPYFHTVRCVNKFLSKYFKPWLENGGGSENDPRVEAKFMVTGRGCCAKEGKAQFTHQPVSLSLRKSWENGIRNPTQGTRLPKSPLFFCLLLTTILTLRTRRQEWRNEGARHARTTITSGEHLYSHQRPFLLCFLPKRKERAKEETDFINILTVMKASWTPLLPQQESLTGTGNLISNGMFPFFLKRRINFWNAGKGIGKGARKKNRRVSLVLGCQCHSILPNFPPSVHHHSQLD